MATNNENSIRATDHRVGIAISAPPTRTEYTAGQAFDKKGMVVELLYMSGRKETITDYSVYPAGALKSSDTFIEANYSGFTARQRIFVHAKSDNGGHDEHCGHLTDNGYYDKYYSYGSKPVAGIRISKNPNKTIYTEGETLDLTGMCVEGWTDPAKKYIITSYVVDHNGPLTYGTNKIKIHCKENTAEFYVTVLPKLSVKGTAARENVANVGGVKSEVNLSTGELTAAFNDLSIRSGALEINIGHVFNNRGLSDCCGTGWNLNLDRTLTPFDYNHADAVLSAEKIDKGEVDYVYTDETGTRHAFDERYYYIKNGIQKKIIDKDLVQVDLDGRLFCETDGGKYDVVREFITSTGLVLSTKLDDIKGVEFVEQRHEDIAKLESEILQYNEAIAELEYNITQETLFQGDAPKPVDEIYQSIYGTESVVAIHKWKGSSLRSKLDELQTKIKNTSLNMSRPDNESKEEESIKEKNATLWIAQRYDAQLEEFCSDSLRDAKEEHGKKTLEIYCERIKQYTIQVEQKQCQLEQYKRQAPIAYLTDGDGVSMCFNEYGELCGIIDKFDNAISVNRGEIFTASGTKTAIVSLQSQEQIINVTYDRKGRIKQLSDGNGKTVDYIYGPDILKKVTFADGGIIRFDYDCDNRIVSITSDKAGEKAAFSYAEHRLARVRLSTRFDKIADDFIDGLNHSNLIADTAIHYGDGKITLESDGKLKTCYLDRYGRLAASSVKDGNGYIARSEFFASDDKNSYTVRETDDAVWTSSEILRPSQKRVAVITADMLKKGETEYVFGAEANKTTAATFDGYSAAFKTPFASRTANGAVKLLRITAKVIQGDKTQEYYMPFDAENDRAQYVALPVRLDKTKLDGTTRIELYAECTSPDVVFDNLRFAPAEWEYEEKDDFGNVHSTITSEKQIAPGVYAHTSTQFTYDNAHKRVVKKIETAVLDGGVKSQNKRITEYSYCEHGNLVRTEAYTEGEEATGGITVTERECDDKGRVVKEWSYNTLDSTTKFYRESVTDENGIVTAELDETGENKTNIEYAEGNTRIKTKMLPNGSKIAYGYDAEGNVTSITQSTADGESNSTETRYRLGSPTRLTSGNNTVLYEYDGKRRMTKATLNGKATEYAYADDATTEEVSVGSKTYPSVGADRTTVIHDGDTFETFADNRGNTVLTKANGQVLVAQAYDKDGKPMSAADNETGSVKEFVYGTDGMDFLQSVSISAGVDVDSLTENYFYNAYGRQSGRALSGAVEQNYAYFYKDNAARDLEHIALPNGLDCFPRTDVNGRDTGKELRAANGENVYGEYVYYRKVGDHGTNMPSSVYFGKTKNGRYSVSDNIKYKYDETGNIREIRENGELAAKYTYDKIGRLVREDNKKLGKSVFVSYDNNGNILSRRETSFTLRPADEIETFADEKQYAYYGDRLLSFGNEVMLYADEQGNDKVNPYIYRGHKLQWNYGRQLRSFGENTFAYDGYGRRVRKNNTVFTYDANNKLIKQSDGINTLVFVYDSRGISGVTLNGTEYIYSKDVLGNIVGILDNTGREVVQYAYDAWGNSKTIVLDETHATVAELNPIRYRGYYYDTETNLYYLNTRYYDPETGRFISQDDTKYLSYRAINGLNLYVYCINNPIRYTDSYGNWYGIDDLIAGFIGATVSLVGYFAGCLLAWEKPKWQDAVGATVGGFVSGVTLLYVGPVLSSVIGASAGNLVTTGLNILSGQSITLEDFAINFIEDIALAAAFSIWGTQIGGKSLSLLIETSTGQNLGYVMREIFSSMKDTFRELVFDNIYYYLKKILGI